MGMQKYSLSQPTIDPRKSNPEVETKNQLDLSQKQK